MAEPSLRRRMARVRGAAALYGSLALSACGGSDPSPAGPSSSSSEVRDNASLFRLITETDPLSQYTLFPNVEETTTGRLNGSEAHRPVVRVTLNATARGALQNGRLPANGRFPDGSIVLKEVRSTATSPTSLYVIMYKDTRNSLAANGWVWAELRPSGDAVYSVTSRGGACTSCHMREQGPQNDLVRTFERQN